MPVANLQLTTLERVRIMEPLFMWIMNFFMSLPELLQSIIMFFLLLMGAGGPAY